MDMMWYRRRGLMVTPHIERVTGAIASFNSAYNKIPIKSLNCNIEPIQSGSGDPSPDNVRPISGRTGVSVVRTGKNLIPTIFDGDVTKNGITFEVKPDGLHATGTATSGIYYDIVIRNNQAPILPAGTYTLSSTGVQQNDVDIRVAEIANQKIIATARTSKSIFTITESKQYFCFFYIPSGTIFNDAVLTPQIEVGSSVATDYEPYKGNTYSVNWQTEAGTVYGGTLDVVSGKLTVDRGYIASYNGEMLPSTWISDRDVYVAGTTPTTGAQVVYKLADPVEYQLTQQEVRTLLDENNIWCDSGDVTVDYWKWGR